MSWELDLKIVYTDGTEVKCTSSQWQQQRADGIDQIFASTDGWQTFENFGAHSVYWLYWEQRPGEEGLGHWVIGQGTVSAVYGTGLKEILFYESGQRVLRDISFMPDLKHSEVKLGWWRK